MFRLNCSVFKLNFSEFHYSRSVKLSPYIKYSAFVFICDFCLSSLALKVFRYFHGVQLFDQIMLACLSGSLFILGIIWVFLGLKPSQAHLRSFIMWMILVSTFVMLFLGPNTVLNIDRSRSFYVLSWVGDGSVRVDDGRLNLDDVASPEKLNVAGIQERIDEQLNRGLIELKAKTYLLTPKGKLLLTASNKIATFYDLTGWFKNRT